LCFIENEILNSYYSMKTIKNFSVLAVIIVMLFTLACMKDEEWRTTADYVKDFEQAPNLVGFWICYDEDGLKYTNGFREPNANDSSKILALIYEYRADGTDFMYYLKKENGHYTHSYDPASIISLDYWYTETIESDETIVYDVQDAGSNLSRTELEFYYLPYNVDTIIFSDYSTGIHCLMVRIADPSKILSTLEIEEY